MLVLTRREGERIQIGDHVCVTVVRIEGGGVRIGIDAPQPMTIVRGEVLGRERSALEFQDDKGARGELGTQGPKSDCERCL